MRNEEIEMILRQLRELKKSKNRTKDFLSISDKLQELLIYKQLQQLKMTELLWYRERYEMALRTAQIGAWNWDHQTEELNFTDIWLQQLGYKQGELPRHSSSWIKNVHPDDLKKAIEEQTAHLEGKTDGYSAEFRMKHKDGHWVWILGGGKVMEYSEDGTPLKSFGVNRVITEDKKEEEILKKIANVDVLTGCGNRLFFDKKVMYEIDKINQNPNNSSFLVLVDIDFFKRFNDNFGHEIGDLVLIFVVDTMVKLVGDLGSVFRVGGEEFGIIFSNVSKELAIKTVKSFQKTIKEYDLSNMGEEINGVNITVSASIVKIEANLEYRHLFRKVDDALYRAKDKGRDILEIDI